MRTINLLIRTSLAVAVLGLGVGMIAGCHRSDDSAVAAGPAAAGNLQSSGGRKPRDPARGGGGGVPDMNDYPAPAGVKTGVQPGGLKR